MAQLSMRGMVKRYTNGFVAVKDFNLEISDREFVVFVGPSGCGKSTTLRMVAGLEDISEGELRIDGRLVNQVPPKDRNVAMVFQSYALYPHMTVYDNMAFGLTVQRVPKPEIDRRVKDAARVLELETLLDRKPAMLSGGQRQRVAMGRAIVRQPNIFLFDEPLSNLDAKLRAQTRVEIARLHRRFGTTSIYVTHDQVEAMTLADRIVVMKSGLVQQVGSPLEIYRRPANRFVADFIGNPSMNFIPAELQGSEVVAEGLHIPVPPSWLAAAAGRKQVVVGIRPEAIRMDGTGVGKVSGTVEMREPVGAELYLTFAMGSANVVGRFDPDTTVTVGESLSLTVDLAGCHLFDPESGVALRSAD